jgi:hypothetical protein
MKPDVLKPDIRNRSFCRCTPCLGSLKWNVGKRLRDNLCNDMRNEHESQPGLKERNSLYNIGPIMVHTQVLRRVKSSFFAEKSLEQPETVLIEYVNQILIHKQICGTVTTFYGSWSETTFYGSWSDFWKVTVPVPTSDQLRFLSGSVSIPKKAQLTKIEKKSCLFTFWAFLLGKTWYVLSNLLKNVSE